MEKEKNVNTNIIKKQFVFGTQETCDFFNISRDTLSVWAKKGAPKEGRGKWDIQKLMEWRFGGTNTESPEIRKLKAEADLKEAKARQEQIKLGVTEEEFLQVKVIAANLRELFTSLKKILLAIGHNVASDLGSLDPEAAIIAKKQVDNRVEDALTQLARGVTYGRKKG